MKRLSLFVTLSALAVASSVTASNAQSLSGTVLIRDSGVRDIPAGTNEIGRFARFIADDRMTDGIEMQLSNRDYEDWKPLEARSKEKMMHFMAGSLKTSHP